MGGRKQIRVEASILSKITDDLPTVPVSSVTRWKHLSDLELSHPDYRIPAGVDILLGGKVLHGRQFSPTGAPSAFKMCFGWVLNGEANGESQQHSKHICGVALNNDLKGVYKRPVGKRTPWQKKKCKNHEVLAGRMLAPGDTVSGISFTC